MKGDLADLQNSLLGTADHNLQALTHVEVALIPVEAIQEIAFARPAVGRAMWYETLVDASIFREWTLNVGRRDARTRAAHMLCEFALRLEAAGLGERCHYELPMTQEQLADALGLTSVHTNRTLMGLGEDGLITRTQRSVRIDDWPRLMRRGDFDPAYLHLDASAPAAAAYCGQSILAPRGAPIAARGINGDSPHFLEGQSSSENGARPLQATETLAIRQEPILWETWLRWASRGKHGDRRKEAVRAI